MKKRYEDPDTSIYAQMGLAAMLPGMVHMLEMMQTEVDNMRTQLAALQGQAAMGSQPKRRTGRPRGISKGLSGWPADPEERKLEMQRRMAKWKVKQPQKESALSKQRKRAWAALSPAKRKARLAAMQAGKKTQAKLKAPVVRMAAAS
jgi:hypothetical protein